MRSIHEVAAALLLALFAQTAAAVTGTFQVTATVNATCTFTTTDVAFGVYNPAASSPNDAAGAVTVTCTNGTTYVIALDAGANAGGASNFGSRQMKANTADYLPYQLYLEAGRTTVWGDGTNSSSLSPTNSTKSTGTGLQQAYQVFGRLLAGQYVAPGSYVDTVNVTVTYP